MSDLADANNLRGVVTFHLNCHAYLLELFNRAAQNGLVSPDEMIIAGHTWGQLNQMQTVQLAPAPVEPPPNLPPQVAAPRDPVEEFEATHER